MLSPLKGAFAIARSLLASLKNNEHHCHLYRQYRDDLRSLSIDSVDAWIDAGQRNSIVVIGQRLSDFNTAVESILSPIAPNAMVATDSTPTASDATDVEGGISPSKEDPSPNDAPSPPAAPGRQFS